MLTQAQKENAVVQIALAVIESVKAAGSLGVPGGTLYAAMMAHGATLAQFESLMRQICATGLVVKRGDLYLAAGA